MPSNRSLRLTEREIADAFADEATAKQFPPNLTIQQASELLQVPVGTLREWRSRGLLGSCSRKQGKHLRFFRNRLLKWYYNRDTNI